MLTLPLILAAISAGLIGGFHCLGMCGGIASILSQLPNAAGIATRTEPQVNLGMQATTGMVKVIPIAVDATNKLSASSLSRNASRTLLYQVQLHGGRLTTYMLIGALFGGLGATSLRWRSELPITTVLFVVGNCALILLGLRLLGVQIRSLLPPSLTAKLSSVVASLMPASREVRAHPFWVGATWGMLPCGLSYAVAPFALLSGAAWSGAVLMLLFGLAALPHLLIAQVMSRQIRQSGILRFVQISIAIVLIGFGLMGLFYFDMRNMPDFLCLTPR